MRNKAIPAVIVLGVAQLIALPLLRFELVRIGPLLVVAFGVLAFLIIRTLRDSSPRERVRLGLYLGASTAIVLALTAPSVYAMGSAVLPLLIGWTVPLVLRDWNGAAQGRFAVGRGPLVIAWLGAAVAIWFAVRPPGPHPIGLDESLYLMQSQYLRHAPFMWPLDQQVAPFFLIRQTYSVPGYLNGQYPPGWPLALALASSLTASWVLLFAVYALLVASTYAFGRAVASARVGALAAGLVAVSGFALIHSTVFLPHVFEASLALIAGTLMITRADAPTGHRAAAWAAAGLFLGFATAMRPLTGVTLAATLWLWVLWRERIPLRRATAITAAACAGAAIPIAFLLYYNFETTGAYLRFGYDLAEHGLHALGFGMRGFVEYTAAGVPTERVAAFGPVQALDNLRQNLHQGLIDFWPNALVFPIAYLAGRAGVEWRWRPLAAFAVLPLAHFFYFYHFEADRFYFELLPFALVGTAFLLHGLAQRRAAAGFAVGALLVATMLVDTWVMAVSRRREYGPWIASSKIVEQLREDGRKLLVFVHSEVPQQVAAPGSEAIRWWGESAMAPLYWYNVYGFPSDVIVARDLGARDSVLSRRFPGRYEVELSVRPGPPGGDPWVVAATPRNR